MDRAYVNEADFEVSLQGDRTRLMFKPMYLHLFKDLYKIDLSREDIWREILKIGAWQYYSDEMDAPFVTRAGDVALFRQVFEDFGVVSHLEFTLCGKDGTEFSNLPLYKPVLRSLENLEGVLISATLTPGRRMRTGSGEKSGIVVGGVVYEENAALFHKYHRDLILGYEAAAEACLRNGQVSWFTRPEEYGALLYQHEDPARISAVIFDPTQERVLEAAKAFKKFSDHIAMHKGSLLNAAYLVGSVLSGFEPDLGKIRSHFENTGHSNMCTYTISSNAISIYNAADSVLAEPRDSMPQEARRLKEYLIK